MEGCFKKIRQYTPRDIAKCSMVHANVVSHDHQDSESLSNKGSIKSPSKLFSLIYQAQSSLGEENRNSSSPKHVNFVNTITIVSGFDKTEEDEPETSKIEEKTESGDIEKGNKSSDEEGEAYEHAINIGKEEEWMEYEIEKENPNNLKIPCMIGRKFIANAYKDLGLPMNVMSLAYYNAIRSQGYKHRGLNFVGTRRDMHVFEGNISYIIDFTILENVESNIDPSLSQVVFGRPFVETTKLILDSEKGLITDGIREVTFKTPYKDPEMDDLTSEGHDLLSSRVILSDDDVRRGCERAWYLESGFHKGVEKLSPLYKRYVERIDLKIPFEVRGSRTSEGIT
ncbi:hypothetical protein Tco_1288784 [Tanacetum coccineum]